MYLRQKNIIQPSTKYLNITVQVLLTYRVNWDKIGYSMLADLKKGCKKESFKHRRSSVSNPDQIILTNQLLDAPIEHVFFFHQGCH